MYTQSPLPGVLTSEAGPISQPCTTHEEGSENGRNLTDCCHPPGTDMKGENDRACYKGGVGPHTLPCVGPRNH